MRSVTSCALSPAKATHLYLLSMTEKTTKRQPGGVFIRTGFTPLPGMKSQFIRPNIL